VSFTDPESYDWEVDMRCPMCAKASIVEIRMRVGASDVTFRRCGRCDSQAWETAEGQISLAHLLELARCT
jgi:hypothetical protein